MVDIANLKLGKGPARQDQRTLRLGKYVKDMPAPPASVDWTSGITDFGAMLNTTLGDCTIAGLGHAVQIWTAVTGNECTISDAAVLRAYERWAGYDPGDPSTDQGAVELDVLNRWRKEGLGEPGLVHTLAAYADPDPANLVHVQQAMALFGGIYIGIELPLSAQRQVGSVWDVVGDPQKDPESQPGSWGGHAVYVPAYDADGVTLITWGALQKMTWGFWQAYVSEAHALLAGGNDWVLPGGNTLNGFSLGQLIEDLGALNNS